MTTGGAGLSADPTGRALPRTALVLRPGAVLLVVVAAWAAVPSLVAPPKLTWAVLAALGLLVLAALWQHAGRLRWTTAVTLLSVVLVCATVSGVRAGTQQELALGAATALLLVGCALLAVNCGPHEVRLLARGLVLLALVELAVALATSLLGAAAPWGYLGGLAPAYDVNELVPALVDRSTGTMSHPIPFGTLMAVAVALCLSPVTRWPVAVRALAGAAACYGLGMSGSRSAALVLVVAALLALLTPGALRIGTAGRVMLLLALGSGALHLQGVQVSAVTSLQGTGSLTHRLAAWDAAVRLTDRSLPEVLLGSGTGSLDDLFAAGFLQLDGFHAVDNQLVTTFAVTGLVGLAALLGLFAVGLLRGDPAVRPAAVLVIGMVMSFDLLVWDATAVLLVALATLGSAARPARAVPEEAALVVRPAPGPLLPVRPA